MELVKLGKKGQLSIPSAILRRVGIKDETPVLIDTTPDGAIIVRQAAVYPIELYSEERIEEFVEADSLPDDQARKIAALLKRPK